MGFRGLVFCFALIWASVAQAQSYGIAMHGDLKYPENFTHFDYVNPAAPKGGDFSYAAIGTYDSLNPFIVKGVAAEGIGMIYQTLMAPSHDEAFSNYGSVAQTIDVADDNGNVVFTLHPQARWHDGEPITAEDIVWSFDTLMEHGAPFYRAYYADVESAAALDARTVKFTFSTTKNRELPLILGQLPVLPKHYWTAEGRNFNETSLAPPLGSAAYRVAKVDPGRSITYERVENWWAADLPVNKGQYNFDTITVQYYRDATVALEALFAGQYDFRQEYIAKVWATGYDNSVVNSGEIVKEEIANHNPVGMQAFIMNTRRPVFQDRAVRRALQLAFDFEWSNKQFAYGAYKRTDSYFENSELASRELPTGRELEILNQFRDQLPEAVFTRPYTNPATDGMGNNRENLRKAIQILEKAGYKLGSDGIRVHEETGQRLSFQIIDNQPEFERWVLPFTRNLRRIGVEASFRVVDTAQYVERMVNFDYDMTVHGMAQSLSPGNEQMEFWHSSRADMPGSRNYMGIGDPVVDALVEMVINAPDREELVARTRALDRVLLWGYYVIPQWHINSWRVAYRNKFAKPDIQAPYALGAMTMWWVAP